MVSAKLPLKTIYLDLSYDPFHLVAFPRQKFQSPEAAVERHDIYESLNTIK